MEELIITSINCIVSVESSLRSLSSTSDYIQYTDSSYSAVKSSETITSLIAYSDSAIDKRRYLESIALNVSASISSTDVRVFRLLYSCFKGYNTYPLLNRELRIITIYQFNLDIYYVSTEMMLINTTQVILQDTELFYKLLGSIVSSTILPMTNIVVQLEFSDNPTSLKSNLFKSFDLNLLTTVQNILYSTSQVDRLCEAKHKSLPITLIINTQNISFVTEIVDYITTMRYKSQSLTIPTINQILEFTNSQELYKLNGIIYTSTVIKPRTNIQVIVYGGDNTFYSLNGFFNYFRYKYQNLMPNLYTILIGNKLINMYNNSMVCIESHKIGHKKVEVEEAFLTDINGLWCSRPSLPLITYENKVVFYYNDKLYTYDFSTISFDGINYYAKDYNLSPQNVSLFYDSLYGMPYICCESTEVSQELTEASEFWNFIQIDNIKELVQQENINDQASYEHELFLPTEYMVSSVVARNKDKLILQGYKGATNKVILLADTLFDGQSITELFSYSGSDVLYCSYPYVYYSKLSDEFKLSSVYSCIIKLDLDLMDYSIIEIEHLECLIEPNNGIWIVYKDKLTSAYYLVREDEISKKINLTVNLNLGNDYILEFKAFDTFVYFITSSRKIYELNYYTLQKREIITTGTPIRLVKFNNTIGCVMTRQSTYLLFEALQLLEWSSNSNDWLTPSDLKKAELLYPYNLFNSILFKRSCPIKTVADYVVAERSSLQFIEKEAVVVSNHSRSNNIESIAPIRVGKCSQLVLSEIDMSNINSVITEAASAEYSESLKIDKTINKTGELELSIIKPQFPEDLAGGYKIYAK